ncbi:MAG: phenylalanine--tRNA ligase subunit beta [Weeping tea tree witches'-broom phytoplasma]|uniref:phenylalanine--tRNA ligase subunit beta n=1 Tax=Candidatus Phytoplasma melaleucae TaxID=2982630 RepID=UPI00293A23B2|nr:phenylalanine--tRNA ligase subunit beta [Weeping tea tree witches'-broom phytoplasma]
MIINENILKEYLISIPSILNLKRLVNDHITQIEQIKYIQEKFHQKKLIIGQVIEIKKNYNQNGNNLAQISIGNQLLSVECHNYKMLEKKKIILLLNQKKTKQKKNQNYPNKTTSKETLNTEILPAQELKLNNYYSSQQEKENLLFLDDEAPIGKCALTYLKLKGFYIELSLTPNRTDLLSHIGFAQDLKAILNNKKNQVNFIPPSKHTFKESNITNTFRAQITSHDCFEYHVSYINNIQIHPSPLWLQNLLITSNIAPMNNVIDVINLVMIEYGIPLNVFDASFLPSQKIKVRNAHYNEKVKISETEEYTLNNNDLVICHDSNIISIAGVINHNKYEINNQTNKIIITAAYFNPQNILITSKKLGINNEKTLRFSRGINQELIQASLEKAIFLLQKLTNCIVCKNIFSIRKKIRQNPEILLPLKLIRNKTGINWTIKKVLNILHRLDYKIQNTPNNILKIVAPSRRYDINIAEDVISDLVRMHGYSKIISQNFYIQESGLRNHQQQSLYKLRHILSYLGFYEIKTYSLTDKKTFNLFSVDDNYLQVIKPISKTKIILRQTLSGGLIEVLSFNQKNDNLDNAFFEIGKVYYKNKETLHLSLGLSGTFITSHWIRKGIESSFFILKGVLETITSYLNIQINLSQTSQYLNLHPGIQADIIFKNKPIGFIGEVHPALYNIYNIKKSFICEINLETIIFEQQKDFSFQKIHKFPSITRDLSFFVNRKYTFKEILETLTCKKRKIMVKCELIDLYYPNQKILPNEHSLSFRFIFNDIDHNLTKSYIDNIMEEIENQIKQKFQAKIR